MTTHPTPTIVVQTFSHCPNSCRPKKKLRTTTPNRIRKWSPTLLLTGRYPGCLRRSDGMRNFLDSMVVDGLGRDYKLHKRPYCSSHPWRSWSGGAQVHSMLNDYQFICWMHETLPTFSIVDDMAPLTRKAEQRVGTHERATRADKRVCRYDLHFCYS